LKLLEKERNSLMRQTRLYLALTLLVSLVGLPSVVYANSQLPCTISGTASSDRINGTPGNDIICAGSGNDVVNGLGGNDIVYGGPGADRLLGGNGDDLLIGEAGNDTLDGGAGVDEISGGLGNDILMGGSGNDEISGDSGSDRLTGGLGDDELSGGENNDTILGDGGADQIQGDSGLDSIQGGTGNDLINGGSDRDSITAGSGLNRCLGDLADVLLDRCVIDNAAPEIGVQAAVVQSFQAGTTIKLNWSASDASGIEKSWASIGGPPGWITGWCGFAIEAQRISGDARNGVYQIECTVPENAVDETYSLFVSASDLLGNSTVNSPQITFSISGGTSDNEAPEVIEINLDSNAKPGEDFSLIVSAWDETGIASIYGWIMKDGGGFASYPDVGLYADALGPAQLITGTGKSGTYKQTLRFSEKAPAGTYTLWLSVVDDSGNRSFAQTEAKITVTN
jgi:Ca2+-binding RTX toxin-like protein